MGGGQGWQAPGLLPSLSASQPGLQDSGPVCRAACHLHLKCLSSLCAPGWRETMEHFSPSMGIWGQVS